MRRRDFIGLIGGAAAIPISARAQRAPLPLIGFMKIGRLVSPDIIRGLADNGLIEGRDFRTEYRWSEFEPQRLPAHAQDLVEQKSAIILTLTHAAALAAKAATRSTPIVFLAGADPVAVGLVESLNRPGGNATGFTTLGYDLIAKRVEVIRELAPSAKSVAYMRSLADPATIAGETREIETAARALNLQLIMADANNPAEVEKTFIRLVNDGAQALVVSGAFVFFASRDQLAGLSISYKIPAIYPTRHYVDSGGLVSFGTHVPDGLYLMGV